jgi:hypothetical protein
MYLVGWKVATSSLPFSGILRLVIRLNSSVMTRAAAHQKNHKPKTPNDDGNSYGCDANLIGSTESVICDIAAT